MTGLRKAILAILLACLTTPVTAAPYCDRAQALSQFLNRIGYLPVLDEPVTIDGKPALRTRWEHYATDLWAVTVAQGPLSCITDHHAAAGLPDGLLASTAP